MRTTLKPMSSVNGDIAHRVYQDAEGTDTVYCQQIDHEDELMRLLAGVERIELRQAPDAGWIRAAMTEPLLQALQAVAGTADTADPRAERVHREMRRRVADVLARIRIRCNRQLLAGVTQVSGGENVLVLVFVRRDIRSCEWSLAA